VSDTSKCMRFELSSACLVAAGLTAACGGRTIRTDSPEQLIPAGCGENVRRGQEACDGTDLSGESCASAGYDGGTLSCTSACKFEFDACTGPGPVCGDGDATGFEACDGTDLVGATCRTLGYAAGGTLSCDGCRYDTSACSGAAPTCGDGNAEGLEECDGIDLRGLDCADFGYTVGGLECDDQCRIVTGRCGGGIANVCGDDGAEGLEECDGNDLRGRNCGSLGFSGGTLSCRNSCKLDTRACTGSPSLCGDGSKNGIEECDGADLGGAGCGDVGYAGGTLACDASCTYDPTGCTPPACGNDFIEPGETCDGTDLGGLDTCADHGYNGGGPVGCLPSCKTFDVSDCTNPPASCGNRQQNNLEQCDGPDLSGQSCTTLGYAQGTLACDSDCSFDVGDCSL
jgi:hypothetical protein